MLGSVPRSRIEQEISSMELSARSDAGIGVDGEPGTWLADSDRRRSR
jgi:hypothetical protein